MNKKFISYSALLVFLASIAALSYSDIIFTDFKSLGSVVVCEKLEVVTPTTEIEVIDTVRRAIEENRSIKAASRDWKGSNISSCADRGGIQINTRGLNRVLSVDVQSKIISVEPGIILWDLNKLLHTEYGLTLPALQEYADVTIGGMIGNGTHGSSLKAFTSSIQDRIVSVRIVNGLGNIETLEAKELDYVASNLGVLGVITQVNLQAEESFKVQAYVDSFEDENLASEILGLASDHYWSAITWFPAQNRYTINAFNKVDARTPGEAHNGQIEAAWWKRASFPLLMKLSHIEPGNNLACLMEKERMKMKSKTFFTDKYAQAIENAVGWSHEMFSFVCRDKCPFDQLPFILQEIAIDLERLPEFIERVQTLTDKTRVCLPLNGIYFRFGRQTRGAISMGESHDVVYVGIEYVNNPYGNRYVKGFNYIQEIEQMLLRDFEARPHWGKNKLPVFEGIKAHYPRWEEFDDFRANMDPNGLFKNEFYRFVNGETNISIQESNCVAEQSCYCQKDSDCPKTYKCQKGLEDPQSRICMK